MPGLSGLSYLEASIRSVLPSPAVQTIWCRNPAIWAVSFSPPPCRISRTEVQHHQKCPLQTSSILGKKDMKIWNCRRNLDRRGQRMQIHRQNPAQHCRIRGYRLQTCPQPISSTRGKRAMWTRSLRRRNRMNRDRAANSTERTAGSKTTNNLLRSKRNGAQRQGILPPRPALYFQDRFGIEFALMDHQTLPGRGTARIRQL